MPSREQLPPLLARSPLSVVDEAVTLMRVSPALFIGLTLASLLPLRALSLLLPGSALRGSRPDQLADALIGNLSAPGAVLAAVFVLAADSIALFVTAVAIGIVLHDWYLGTPISSRDLARRVIRRLPAALAVWLFVHLVQALAGVFSGGIGAVIAVPIFAVAAPVLGIERCGALGGFRRAVQLGTGRFGHSILSVAMIAVASLIFRLVIRGVPSIIAMQLFELPTWISVNVADLVSACFTNLFVACAANVLYLDLRVRREGLDLQLLMERAFERNARTRSRLELS